MKGADAGAALGGMLCGLAFGLVIGALVGGILLRAAVSLYNRFAGGWDSPNAVPEPSFPKAMGISLAVSIANAVVGALIGAVVGALGFAAQGKGFGPEKGGIQGLQILAQLIALPVSFFVAAGMLSALLPTTFGRAAMVALCYILVGLLLAIILAAVGIGAMLLLKMA